MSVKVHEGYCLDSQQDRLTWWDDFLGDQLQDEWFEAGTGSAVVVDAQTGGIVRIATGATTNDVYYIDWQNYRSLLVTKKATIEVRLKLNDITQEDIWISLYNAWNDLVMFQYTPVAGAGDWLVRTRAGGANTQNNSGIAADTDYHIFRIECFPTDEIHFYIDGVETANSPITTNITALYLQPRLYVLTKEDVIKSVDIDYVAVRQEI